MTAPSMNLTFLDKQDGQFCAVSGREVAHNHENSCRADVKSFGQLALVSACMVKGGNPLSVQDR